jgi:regulator of chromosome condensation
MHTVALSEDGSVYSWGCNDEGALGRPSNESNEFDPLKVQFPEETRILQICAGDSHSAALSSGGIVYVWGVFRDSNGPFGLIGDKPSSLPQVVYANQANPAVKIASGSDHLTLLTLDGTIVTLGCGEQGQLGRIHEYFSFRGGRKGIQVLLTPAPVKFKKTRGIPTPRFCDVFCGSYHTFALTMDKQHVYAWGLNNYGQLGTDDTDNRFQPERLSNSWDPILEEGLKEICGGQHHSILCTTTGTVYALGRSEYGRLGLGDVNKEFKLPQRIPVLSNMLSVAAGTCVSFAVGSEGEAHSWGMGTNYQLSSGSDDDVLSPTKMRGKNLAGKKVLSVSSGGQHTALLVCDKD